MIKTLNKILVLSISLTVTSLVLGLILSPVIRIKASFIFSTLINGSLYQQVLLFFVLWGFWTLLQTIRKLYKSKGFNSSFWNDL
jgi:ABC-type Mn2+/Zn2+ transport system permease subunit